MNNKMIELENCSFIKTILMVLVVLCHSLAFWTNNWFKCCEVAETSLILGHLSNWLGTFHIYGFVLVSGYIFCYLKNELGKYNEFKPFVLKKIKRLIVPYFFAMFIWVMPINAYLYQLSLSDILSNFILCTSPAQLWFLWMLFDIFLIIWPLDKLLKNNIVALTICVLSWGIGILGAKFIPNIFGIWNAFNYLPYFVIGMKIQGRGGCVTSLKKIPGWIFILTDIILFAVIQYISNMNGIISKYTTFCLEYVVHIVGALMAFFVLQKLANKINWKKSKTFVFLSKRTMPVYLFHQQIIYFIIIWLNGKVAPLINASINFVAAMAVSLIIGSILMRFKITSFLIGEYVVK